MKRPDLNNFLFGVGEGTGNSVPRPENVKNFQFTANQYNPGIWLGAGTCQIFIFPLPIITKSQ